MAEPFEHFHLSELFEITPGLAEHEIWRDLVLPKLRGLPQNVLELCEYGFTEMVNNAIDHSGSPYVQVFGVFAEGLVDIRIADGGIGIFRKIQQSLGLENEQHAILELSKGKVTTAPDRHTGEGIFFASRMFDEFCILSGNIAFMRYAGEDWTTERKSSVSREGTFVGMQISPSAEQTVMEVLNRYAVGEDLGFDQTRVSVALARFEGETLVSRSQAKRLLAGLNRFRKVTLDFYGITSIGPAFADEVFRVFVQANAGTRIDYLRAVPDVERMIARALSQSST